MNEPPFFVASCVVTRVQTTNAKDRHVFRVVFTMREEKEGEHTHTLCFAVCITTRFDPEKMGDAQTWGSADPELQRVAAEIIGGAENDYGPMNCLHHSDTPHPNNLFWQSLRWTVINTRCFHVWCCRLKDNSRFPEWSYGGRLIRWYSPDWVDCLSPRLLLPMDVQVLENVMLTLDVRTLSPSQPQQATGVPFTFRFHDRMFSGQCDCRTTVEPEGKIMLLINASITTPCGSSNYNFQYYLMYVSAFMNDKDIYPVQGLYKTIENKMQYGNPYRNFIRLMRTYRVQAPKDIRCLSVSTTSSVRMTICNRNWSCSRTLSYASRTHKGKKSILL